MAITKACKGKLAEACVDDRVDVSHPAVVKYLVGRTPTPDESKPLPSKEPRAKRKVAAPAAVAAPAVEGNADADLTTVEPYASMSLRDLIAQFGSVRAFKDHLDALKKIEDIRKTRLDNDQTEGTLISRELVKGHVLSYIDSAQRRLLTDTPKTIVARIYARARADEPIEVAVEETKKLIQDQLRPLKAAATRNLRENATP